MKILNNENARGFPVLRSEPSRKGQFNPRAYAVFGPKLIGTRGFFEDRALESRCITEELGQSRLREDIPTGLPDAAQVEARQLRNQLLLFRFRNRQARPSAEHLVDPHIEPRLNQIFVPLLSLIEDAGARAELQALARRVDRQLVADHGSEMEAQVLEVIRDLLASSPGGRPTIKQITEWFVDRFGEEYDRKVTAKWIGSIIRKKLRLYPQKSHGVFVIPPSEEPKLARLYEKYGIAPAEDEERGVPEEPGRVDMGDVGDVAPKA